MPGTCAPTRKRSTSPRPASADHEGEPMSNDEKSRRLSRRRFIQGAAAAAAGAPLALRAKDHDDDDDHGRDHGRACGEAPDVNLVNGRFLTMDARNSVGSALAIRDGRIARVGHAGELGPCGRPINPKGATVIPGLIDTHVHFLRCGQNPGHEVRIIETAASIAELQQMIRARIAELKVLPGQELVNFITCIGGWNTNGLAEKRLPSVADLDAAAPGIPVYLSTTGAGGAVTNTPGAAFFTSRGIAVAANGTRNAGRGL